MKEVVVIGAGVIGLCTAYYAAQRGFRVTVIDRHGSEHEGCSYGNAGMIVPSHFVPLAAPGAVALGLKWMFNPESPFWIKPRLEWDLMDWGMKFWRASNAEQVKRAAPLLRDLHLASRDCFDELAAGCGNEFGLVRRGLLALCKTQRALDEEGHVAEKAQRLGVPAEVLNARDLAKLEPGARADVVGAIYFPKDCHLTPQRFMARMKQAAEQAGVKFQWGTNVRGFRRVGNEVRAVTTSSGEIQADEFVLCAGSWSTGVGREIGLKLPMQPGKGYTLTLPNPPALPTICSILVEARVAVTPMGNSLRVGGTMEMAGLNEEINSVRVAGITKAMSVYYPEFKHEHFEGLKVWRGLRPVSPDGLPYLGRTAKYKNLIVATGHAMMGLSLGPISGKLVAETLSDEKPSINIELLSPDRYA
ncbi:MAG TPA: FAD-dependent oxidoreductase [Verrucomicrobiae bacterium]